MKYNKALDMIAMAIVNMQAGKVLTASKLFANAATDRSIASALQAIEAANAKGFASLKASNGRTRLRSSIEEDLDLGDDMDIEAAGDEESEGWPFTASDDLEMDDDGGELDLEADADEFTLDDDGEDDELDAPEEAKATASRIAQARFSRALVNLQAAKKKAAAKKPAAKKR
jgi:hypothetical protein